MHWWEPGTGICFLSIVSLEFLEFGPWSSLQKLIYDCFQIVLQSISLIRTQNSAKWEETISSLACASSVWCWLGVCMRSGTLLGHICQGAPERDRLDMLWLCQGTESEIQAELWWFFFFLFLWSVLALFPYMVVCRLVTCSGKLSIGHVVSVQVVLVIWVWSKTVYVVVF